MSHVPKTFPNLSLTMETKNLGNIQWWVDTLFAVHPDMRSHTGATGTLGLGSFYTFLSKQKINTRSSTKAKLVGVNNIMGAVLWTQYVLEAQGYKLPTSTIYQDSRSAMFLEKNERKLSGKMTWHVNIQYYFVTNCIAMGEVDVKYCPTGDMIAEFYTKPLQGSDFYKFWDAILNTAALKWNMTSCRSVLEYAFLEYAKLQKSAF